MGSGVSSDKSPGRKSRGTKEGEAKAAAAAAAAVKEAKADEKADAKAKAGQPRGKLVKIQALAPKEPREDIPKSVDSGLKNWQSKCCSRAYEENCDCTVLTYEENVVANVPVFNSAFYTAFLEAYNSHQGVILSPDDIWLFIILQLSKYINDHAEELRSVFVQHDGKKKLVVTTTGEKDERQWDEFFNKMIAAIKTETKPGVVETFQADFSTTGRLERIVTTAAVMDSFKKYFDFGRLIPGCGITHVEFLGTADDWLNLIDRVANLDHYDVDGTWKSYIANLAPVLKKLYDTYNDQVDVDWWNRIMNFRRGRFGSGQTQYVSGWILAFYGLTGNVDVGQIEEHSINVPMEIDNRETGHVKTVHLVGGFGGVHLRDNSFRPQTSFAIIHSED